jgi:hypothetical protein
MAETCPECAATFATPADLIEHLKTAHADEGVLVEAGGVP